MELRAGKNGPVVENLMTFWRGFAEVAEGVLF
jgi:hypothetical protein